MSIDTLIAAALESTETAVSVPGVNISVPAMSGRDDMIPIVGMVMIIVIAVASLAALVLLVRVRGARRERLIMAAIQSGQPELAKEMVSGGAVVLWIIAAIVAIVFIQNMPYWATLIVAIIAIGTFREWGGILHGRMPWDKKEKGLPVYCPPTAGQTFTTQQNIGPSQPSDKTGPTAQG